MGRETQWRYLMDIIRYSLSGEACPVMEGEPDWEYLYRICENHRIGAMVYSGVEHMPQEHQPPHTIMEKLQKKRKLEIFRDEIQHASFLELLDAFEEEGIDCIPLKGIWMKQFYPDPSLRMMADLDILYRPEQEEKVHRVLLSKGYYCDHKDAKNNVYLRKPAISVEMHHMLMTEESGFCAYYETVWERAELQEGKKFIYRFKWEDFYIFMVAHLLKHVRNGGSGIRSIVDIWMFMDKMEEILDWAYVKKELGKLRIEAFERHIRKLADIWFHGEGSTEFYDTLTEFFVESGLYGNIKNHYVYQVMQEDKKKKNIRLAQISVKMGVVFPPLTCMKRRYAWLERYPALLPAAWLMRVLQTVFLKRGRASQVLQSATVEKNVLKKRQELFRELEVPLPQK